MEMQNPKQTNNAAAFPFRPAHHRRAHSEVNFCLSEDLDLVPDPFDANVGTRFEEMVSEDDLFSTYMDIEKLGGSNSNSNLSLSSDNAGGGSGAGGGDREGEKSLTENSRPRHRYSNSVDSSSLMLDENCIDAKKAMAPDKLAELWTLDPKRAKRILANRQSAARSKERKARYMSELERKVQTLQTEATTLSAQLTLFQRDTTGLTTENTELKLRLQAMEQQAQLCDALNEALKQELQRLRVATGEIAGSSDSETYNFGIQNFQYSQSALFGHQPQSGPRETHSMQMPQFSNLHHGMLSHLSHSLAANHTLQDPLGRFQGLDIGSRGSLMVKPEGPSLSASESSSTF